MPSAPKLFVTGATGFVGSHLAERLLDEGASLRLLVRDASRLTDKLRESERVEVVEGDLHLDPAAFAEALKGCDEVYHVAGLIGAIKQEAFDRVNAEGTRNIIEAIHASETTPKRFLLVSSLAAYGPADALGRPRMEDDEPQPATMYGRSKLAGEKIAWELCEKYAIPLSVIRPSAVYGPRDPAIFEFFKFTSRGLEVGMMGGPRSFDIVHVDDLVRAIVQAARSNRSVGHAYQIGDEGRHELSEILRLLRKIMKPRLRIPLIAPVFVIKLVARINDVLQRFRNKPIYPNTDKLGELLPKAWHCSCGKAREHFGFSCAVPLHKGLAQTALWYQQAGWLRLPKRALDELETKVEQQS